MKTTNNSIPNKGKGKQGSKEKSLAQPSKEGNDVPKTKVYNFPEVSVDAANITVADLKYIRDQGGDLSTTAQEHIIVTRGKEYEVTITMPDFPDGPLEKTGTIKAMSDALIVGDICYSFHGAYEELGNLIRTTNGLKKFPRLSGISLDTKRDGGFSVRIEIREKEARKPGNEKKVSTAGKHRKGK